MPLPTKTRLGPYEIQTLLGAGGMGEVYLARDTRLGRIVAIKVISDEHSRSDAARERFQMEARAASALNHPNICTLYDVGEWMGKPFIAMEYVEGQLLAEMLRQGPMPIPELVSLFSKLASALESAHQHGIIHRDIKPSNIVVTHHGEPKIMDFGLAKLLAPRQKAAIASADSAWAEPPETLTAPGSAVGTVAYMSPEQARGEDLDGRTDLFSLGLILYEAATGRRALAGNTVAVIFARLLREEPEPPRKVNPSIPVRLADVIDKALEKESNFRYQSASDMLTDLRRVQRELETDPTGGRARARRESRWQIALGLSVLFAAAAAALFFSFRQQNAVIRPQALTANSVENTIISSTLSPDGKMIAYGDRLGIHLESVSTHEFRTLPRPRSFSRESGWWPVAWFPDGSRLLATATAETSAGPRYSAWVVSTLSEMAVKIRDDSIPYSVSPDNSLVAFTTNGVTLANELWVMGLQGQDARQLNTGPGEATLSAVHWSPDSHRLVYRKELIEDGSISIQSTATDASAPVTIAPKAENWGDVCYLDKERLLYSAPALNAQNEDMNLWTLPLSGRTGAPSGAARQATDWSGFEIEDLSLSSDAKHLSFDKVMKQTDVYVMPLHTREPERPRRFTLDDYNDLPFFWSPDNKYVYFASEESGSNRLWRQDINEDQPELVLANASTMNPIRLSPDGESVVYIDHAGGDWKLKMAPLGGGASEAFGIKDRVFNVSCAASPATNCVFGSRSPDQKRFIFSEFNLPSRAVHRLFEIEPDPRQGLNWTLSPDGKKICAIKNHTDSSEIDVYAITGELTTQVHVSGFNHLMSIDWARDNKSWFVGAATTNGCAMLHILSDGKVEILASMRGRGMRPFGFESPNGRYIAFLGWTIARNVYIADWNRPSK